MKMSDASFLRDAHELPAKYLTSGSLAYRHANFALFCAGFSTFSLLYCVQPMLPLLAQTFHLSPATTSMSLSSTTFLLAFSILIVGLFSEKMPRKKMMAWSLFLSAGLTLIAGFLPNWSALLVTRALLGVALGGVPAVAMAYLAEEVHPDGLGLAMGLYIGGTAFGGMAGRFITGLVTDFFSWRIAMTTIGALGVMAALLFVLYLPRSSRFVPGSRVSFQTMRVSIADHLSDWRMPALFAMGFLLMGSFVAIYNYAGFRLLGAPYYLNQSTVGSIFIVYLVGIVASAWFGRLADRHGRRKMLAIGASLMLIGSLITLAHSLLAIVIGIALLTFGFFAAHSVASGAVGRLAKRHKAQATSLYLLAYYLGSSVLGFAGGILWARRGWNGVIELTSLALLCAVFICYRMKNLDGDSILSGR